MDEDPPGEVISVVDMKVDVIRPPIAAPEMRVFQGVGATKPFFMFYSVLVTITLRLLNVECLQGSSH